MKKAITIIGIMVTTYAFATDDANKITTSQRYVETQLANHQDKIPAKSGDKVVTPTETKGTIGERDIKTTLGDETTNQNDTDLTTVKTVKAATDAKQDKFRPLGGVNVVTYTGTTTVFYDYNGTQIGGPGITTTTPIYDDTVNTYGNGLVRAETLNTAVQRGVSRALTRVPAGFVINNIGNVLPTTAYLDASISPIGHCYKRIQTDATHNDAQNSCSTTLYNDMARGDWGLVVPYETDITYNGTCTGTSCNNEIHGITACINTAGTYGIAAPASLTSTLQTAYENGKSSGTPSGTHCYCKVTNPKIGTNTTNSPWVYRGVPGTSRHCALFCASDCAVLILIDQTLRSAVFGGVNITQ